MQGSRSFTAVLLVIFLISPLSTGTVNISPRTSITARTLLVKIEVVDITICIGEVWALGCHIFLYVDNNVC